MDNIQFAKKIKQLCKENKITVKVLLEHCGISKSFIYELEKRGRVPLTDKLELIADYLEVSVDYLLGRTDNPQGFPPGFSPVYNSNQDISQSFSQESKNTVMTKEESEILHIYRLLDVRDRIKLMSFVFELENNIKQEV